MKRKEVTRAVKDMFAPLDDGDAEAEWLVALTLKVRRSEVGSNDPISDADQNRVLSNASKRLAGWPIAYIFESANFYGYDLKVDERVLIPRPETEEVVSAALGLIEDNSTVLDLGTGSGAIAIAIAKNSKAEVYACDYRQDILDLAKENATRNGAKVNFFLSDVFSGMGAKKFDVIVSNPPYISLAEYKTLDKAVKREPKAALVSGKTGLEFYQQFASKGANYLNKNGKLVLEIGYSQGQEVSKLLENNFKDIKVLKDLEKNDRIVIATRK